MKRALLIGIIVSLSCGLILVAGCAKKASSVSELIQNSQSLKTIQEKVTYLIDQAQVLYNSKEFQQAIEVAQYVLSKLDNGSAQAKDLIERAKTQLQAAAQKAVGETTNKLFGK